MSRSNDLSKPGETNQAYLGDGIYASFDGYHIWLRTAREEIHEIALDQTAFQNLIDYHKSLDEGKEEGAD
jgi:hypothetical protein